MDYSTADYSVLHYLLESAQVQVHCISDAIQPSHPLLFPSPPAFDLSQHQSLFQWVSSFASGGQSIGASALASVLPMNIQGRPPLGLTTLISLQYKRLSRSSPSPQFESSSSSACSLLYGPTLTDLNRCFSKEDTQMADTWKDAQCC